MLVAALLAFAVAQAPADTDARRPAIVDTALVSSVPAVMSDTPTVRRRHAVSYDDSYYTRLTIHRYGSYAMLPLFAAEYALGQNLINDNSPPSWMKPTHNAVAFGIGAVFTVNTVTGAWNLWDSRDDPSGRTRRFLHTALMLASDAGFAITGAIAPGDHARTFAERQAQQNRHRNWALGSIGLSTAGAAMMWFWKQ
jgi:hypothetical protein